MKHNRVVLLLAAMLAATANVKAGTSISFDPLQTGEDVLNYYNGGYGSLGSGPGPSDGVIFSPGWIASGPDAYGGVGHSAAISGTVMIDIPAGWSQDTSFYYRGAPLTVTFYSQQNGLGSVVRTLNLGTPVGFTATAITGTFESAVFVANAGTVDIDALTNGSVDVIPEPRAFGFMLVATALIVIGVLRRVVQPIIQP